MLSRAYRLHHRWLIDLLFFGDFDHCRLAYESERLRLQVPPELRTG